MAETARWYVVHTYSGYENTVKATIEKTVESRNLQDQILAISIPLETVTEITETGVRKTDDRKDYPRYVLAQRRLLACDPECSRSYRLRGDIQQRSHSPDR